MAQHQNPKVARRGLRSGVTKLLAEIRGELDKGDDGSKIKLGVYLNRMSEKLTKAKRLDFAIMEMIDNPEEAETEAWEADKRLLEMEEIIAILRNYLMGDQPAPEDIKEDGKKVQSFAKLPKLEIKYFSGDPLEFPTFQQQFDACIGRSELADVRKFSYLKGLLKGEALRSIQGLSMTNANYKGAWELLTRRYGRRNLWSVLS